MIAAPQIVPGDVVFLDYGEMPRCVHTRLVTGLVDPNTHEFTILTPDHDEYIEILHQSNTDLAGIHFSAPGSGNPPGIPANVIYSFAPMTAAELARWLTRGRTEAAAERQRRGSPVECGCRCRDWGSWCWWCSTGLGSMHYDRRS